MPHHCPEVVAVFIRHQGLRGQLLAASVLRLQPPTLLHVDDNPGGYGTPNPDRVNVAWIVVVQYMGTSETEDITPEAYTPTSATQITIPITKDGHIQVNGFLINVIAGGENDGDYGYDTADDKVKLLTLGVWVEVTDLTTLLSVDGLISNILHIPVIIQASQKKNDVNY